MSDELVRGVIDRFEGDYAVIVLDDEQQLDWPRSALLADVQPGMAVVLSLAPAAPRAETADDRASAQAAGSWQGQLRSRAGGWVICLAGEQTLRWPGNVAVTAQSGGQVSLQLAVDAEDTEARRKRVAGLLDDIFGAPR